MAYKLPFKLPKNAWDEVIPPHQTKYMLEHGWQTSYKSGCHICHGKGCKRCYGKGVVLSLYKPGQKETKHYQGAIWQEARVGGLFSITWSNVSNTFMATIKATNGDARFELTLPQMWQVLSMVINVAADMMIRNRNDQTLDMGCTAAVVGPPVMYIAGLRPKGGQRTRVPSPTQKKAIDLLHKNGFHDEAGLLEQSMNHECFLVDMEEKNKARKAIGKLKPGTIFERKGNKVTFADEETGEEMTCILPDDRSVLSGF